MHTVVKKSNPFYFFRPLFFAWEIINLFLFIVSNNQVPSLKTAGKEHHKRAKSILNGAVNMFFKLSSFWIDVQFNELSSNSLLGAKLVTYGFFNFLQNFFLEVAGET